MEFSNVVQIERLTIDQVGCIKDSRHWDLVEKGKIKERWNSMNFSLSKAECCSFMVG